MKTATLCFLLAVTCLVVLARCHTFFEPLERDITNYSLVAHEMLSGKHLYTEVWDQKPPGIFLAYCVAELLVGFGPQQVFFLNVLACVGTLFAVFIAGSACGAATGSFWAAIFWALLSGTPLLEANQPNTEVFINVFLGSAFAILITSSPTRLGIRNALLVGGLLFGASLFKHIIVIIPLFWAMAFVATSWDDAERRRNAIKDFSLVVLVGALGWVLVFSWFAAVGSLHGFLDAVFVFNGYYAENPLKNLVNGFRLSALAPDFFRAVLPLYAFLVLALWLAFRRGDRRASAMLLSYVLGAHVTLALFGEGRVTLAVGGARPEVGHGYPHYYQIFLPALVIGAGWLPGLLGDLKERFYRAMAPVAGVLMVLYLAAAVLPYYLLSAPDWSRLKYGEVFVEQNRFAAELEKILLPNESFYVWGAESNLHHALRRRPPSGGVFSFYAMLAGPLVEKLTSKTISDLEAARPDLLVVYKPSFNPTHASHPVLRWFASGYLPVPASLADGNFALFVKEGSALAGRLKISRPTGN